MTASEFARKISAGPFPIYALQLLGQRGSTAGFNQFLEVMVNQCRSYIWAGTEFKFDQFPTIVKDFYQPHEVVAWMDAIQKALTALGRYDPTDDIKWESKEGACDICFTHNLPGPTLAESCSVCTHCGRRYWFATDRWQQVTDPIEWDSIRAGIIAETGLLAPTEVVVDDDGEGQMPHRVLWPIDFQHFDQWQEIGMVVPVSWDLKAGEVIEWTLAQFNGTARVVRCEAPDDDRMICYFKKVS